MSGDTLVEVMFAVGIFSMIVISSITVMNSGTRDIQRDLEITTTRNEIDSQAEALRFIQTSYANERVYPRDEWQYGELWNTIVDTKNIIDLSDPNSEEAYNKMISYNPSTCEELYINDGSSKGEVWKYGFILNYRNLSRRPLVEDAIGGEARKKLDVNQVYYRPTTANVDDNVVEFKPTTLYPRLMFNDKSDVDGDQFYSNEEEESYRLKSVDGLYVIAIKDKEGRYYDFYIRSCWASSDAGIPTLTSTVIRLYNPEIDGIK